MESWTYSWRWESPEESSWCQRHSSRRCLSPPSEGSSSSVGPQWKDFYCQTPAILKTGCWKRTKNTHRPCLQDLVHPEQHQSHQATQEDVHEHPTEKQILFKSLNYPWALRTMQQLERSRVSWCPPRPLQTSVTHVGRCRGTLSMLQLQPCNIQVERLNPCNRPAVILGGKATFAGVFFWNLHQRNNSTTLCAHFTPLFTGSYMSCDPLGRPDSRWELPEALWEITTPNLDGLICKKKAYVSPSSPSSGSVIVTVWL